VDYNVDNQIDTVCWLNNVITNLDKKEGDITIIYCSDLYLQKLNIDYLNKDYFTDIITFDYVEDNIISGDLFISIDRVKENADSNAVEFREELDRVMVHGILHLLGYADKSEEDKIHMRNMEDAMLKIR
jgi:rRNA maturation RNase YbeY